jgi:hypothetical protein
VGAWFPVTFPRHSEGEQPESLLGDVDTPSHDGDVQTYMKTTSRTGSVEKYERERLEVLDEDVELVEHMISRYLDDLDIMCSTYFIQMWQVIQMRHLGQGFSEMKEYIFSVCLRTKEFRIKTYSW